jgi:hypothetical protein
MRLGVGFVTRLAISLLGLGGAARNVIWLCSSLVCSHLQAMAVMMPDKRHVEIKRPQMDAKCRNWRRKTNGGECGNSKNGTDFSHDLAAYVAFEGVAISKARSTINIPVLALVLDYANSSNIEVMAEATHCSKRRHAQKAYGYCRPPL